MRPYWKGYLKLALVSCPIALHAACSTAERIAFRQINKATGNRLRQQLIDDETREPVAPEHKGRGYEVAKGQYLIVEDEELAAIEIESTHVIEIDSFVPRQQIDQRFFDNWARPHMAGVGRTPRSTEVAEDVRDFQSRAGHARRQLCRRQRSEAIQWARDCADRSSTTTAINTSDVTAFSRSIGATFSPAFSVMMPLAA